MSAVAVLVFMLAIPLAMAAGMRFSAWKPALQCVGALSAFMGLLCAILLGLSVEWLSIGTLIAIWFIATITPLSLGMASWRTPDLIDGMQIEFNRVVEPYAGRPVSLLGWAHRIYDLLPSRLVGVAPKLLPH